MSKLLMVVILIICLPVIAAAQMGGGMMGDGGMMGPGRGSRNQQVTGENSGTTIFGTDCARCHPQGGNPVYPDLPLRGSPQLKDFRTFLAYLRHPVMPDGSPGPMPAFSPERISDEQAEALYRYMGDAGMIPNAGELARPPYAGSGIGRLPKPLDRKLAVERVADYLKETNNPNLKIGTVRDKGSYFEVDIVTKNRSLIDKLKVDKKTGQMGSVY